MKLVIDFVKYQGCGNDFIIIDELDHEIVPEELKGAVSRIICKRRFSVGADDVLYLLPSNKAHAWMRIFEPDGTEADMCGNGIRCAASYLCEKLRKNSVLIETKAGAKLIKKIDGYFKVDMGRLLRKLYELKDFVSVEFEEEEDLIGRRVSFPLVGELEISIVKVGEPHAVIFVEDVEKEDMEEYAKAIAMNKKFFPKGISVNLVQIVSENTIKVRTYERGVWGETLACGTGSTASAAVAYILGKVKDKKIKVKVRGGELTILVEGNALYLIGPAQKVFDGRIEINV